MAILKCKLCGGDIEANDDRAYGTCLYCGTQQTLPNAVDDQKANFHNRANHFRRQNEFDKAASAYDSILNLDPSDAEAHWGLVLSKYGIEYVEDPITHERIPTCHRVHNESILTDADYLAVLEYAGDRYTCSLYEAEAKRIATIQRGILAISAKEDPYDVFICYKETSETGSRTVDSAMAQDVYYGLTQEGYKVFFARITLEEKLGQQYEPYIFAGLNSAKVMLVIGTRPEHFNAVWVRNEWSRFLALMKEDRSKQLIPCYRDMDAYALPEALSMLQSQDMNKIGFMQDLIRGIKKVLDAQPLVPSFSQNNENSLERWIQKAGTYLVLNNYEDARNAFNHISQEYPEDYRGWWGLMVCYTKDFTEVFTDQSTLNVWFRYARQLADPKRFSELEKIYIKYTKKASALVAVEDIKATNSFIHDHNDTIQGLEQEIASKEASKSQFELLAKTTVRDDNHRISISSEELKTSKKAFRSYISMQVFGVGIVLLGLTLLAIWGVTEPSAIGGIVIGIAGIWVIKSAGNKKTGSHKRRQFKKDIQEAKGKLANATHSKTQHVNDYRQEMRDFDDNIRSLKQQIISCKEKIVACKTYSALGKDSIATMFFAQKCEAFDVHQSYDKDILSCRNAAFGIQEKPADEEIAISCPTCKAFASVKQSDVFEEGSIICGTCGSTIEIGMYDVDCPDCGQAYIIDEFVFQSGKSECPNCNATFIFQAIDEDQL